MRQAMRQAMRYALRQAMRQGGYLHLHLHLHLYRHKHLHIHLHFLVARLLGKGVRGKGLWAMARLNSRSSSKRRFRGVAGGPTWKK